MSRRGSVLENFNIDAMNPQTGLEAARATVQNRELDMRAQQHKADQKAIAKKDATDFIGGLKIDDIGDNTIDILTHKQLEKLQGDLMDMQAKGADVITIKTEAYRRLPAIANGHTIAKNKYDQIKTGLADLNKDYPTGDLGKARELAMKPMLQDVLNFDDKGQPTGYKDPSLIPERNYLADVDNEQNLGKWYKPSGALNNAIKAYPNPVIGESKKVRDKNGKEKDVAWDGHGSMWVTPDTDPETGVTKGLKYKAEKVPLGVNPDGTTAYVDAMPKDEFNLLMPTKTAKADFTLMFNKHLTDNGIDPQTLDPRAKDVAQREFALQWMKKTNIDGSSFIPKQVAKEPLPPRISVKVNTGAKEVPVIDVYSTIYQKATEHLDQDKYKPVDINGKSVMGVLQANILDDNEQAVVLEKARKASKGDANIGIEDIYVQKFPDGLWIMRAEDNKPLTKLTPTGTNVSANTPLGVKSKQEAVKDAKTKEANTPANTFDIVDPTTGKVVMKGVDENAANKAKSKGYKIQ